MSNFKSRYSWSTRGRFRVPTLLVLLFLILTVSIKFSSLAERTGYSIDTAKYQQILLAAKEKLKAQQDKFFSSRPSGTWEGYSVKPVAYVFPQFHAIPENDKFWGVNFTEWDNVRKVTKNRFGLETLRPTEEVGYYNLLDYDVRKRYAKLVEDSGYVSCCPIQGPRGRRCWKFRPPRIGGCGSHHQLAHHVRS